MTRDSRFGGPLYEDQKIPCPGCGHWWIRTAKEQKEHIEKGLRPPRRCETCRRDGVGTRMRRPR